MSDKIKTDVLQINSMYTTVKAQVGDKKLSYKQDKAPRVVMVEAKEIFIPNKPEPRFDTIEDLLKATRPNPNPLSTERRCIVPYNDVKPVSYGVDKALMAEALRKERMVLKETSWTQAHLETSRQDASTEARSRVFVILAITVGLGVTILCAAVALQRWVF